MVLHRLADLYCGIWDIHTKTYGGIVRNVERDRRELDKSVVVRQPLFMRHGWFPNGHP